MSLSSRQVIWDRRFLDLLNPIAQWSKDPSTKTAAVIVRPDRTISSVGYNGFPRGMDDTPALYDDREKKYSRVIHCEINAVLAARERVEGYTLYTLGPSCDRCAVHMIQSGIKRFVFTAPSTEQYTRWNVARTLGYFLEVNAEVWQYRPGVDYPERLCVLSNMPGKQPAWSHTPGDEVAFRG